MIGRSASHRELVEGPAEPVGGEKVGGYVVVAAAQILHERMPGSDDPRGAVAFQPADRPEPGLQPAMICSIRLLAYRSTVCSAEGISSSRPADRPGSPRRAAPGPTGRTVGRAGGEPPGRGIDQHGQVIDEVTTDRGTAYGPV